MTRCVSGDRSHDFPVEDSVQAYCQEHGVRLVWKSPDPLPELPNPEPATEPAT
ncbi:hypothetical protein [Streptomyces sp. NRRL S-15]|uniref:hypothetical protein n=1 Tax=Streptomyces sp. NRRL S-15 TaxID=1463886 RepID=UPI000A62E5D0|nr:hypothetical protein [Streptomyces sp. NRRL S-15]